MFNAANILPNLATFFVSVFSGINVGDVYFVFSIVDVKNNPVFPDSYPEGFLHSLNFLNVHIS